MIALGCDHGGYELKQEIIKYRFYGLSDLCQKSSHCDSEW